MFSSVLLADDAFAVGFGVDDDGERTLGAVGLAKLIVFGYRLRGRDQLLVIEHVIFGHRTPLGVGGLVDDDFLDADILDRDSVVFYGGLGCGAHGGGGHDGAKDEFSKHGIWWFDSVLLFLRHNPPGVGRNSSQLSRWHPGRALTLDSYQRYL